MDVNYSQQSHNPLPFRCDYCKLTSSSADEIIEHSVRFHRNNVLKINSPEIHPTTGHLGYMKKNFGIVPGEILKPNESLRLHQSSWEIYVEKNTVPDLHECAKSVFGSAENKDVPINKKKRDENEDKNFQRHLKEDIDALEILQNECLELLPTVLEKIHEAGHLDDWVRLNRMISSDTFPYENIAFLLFMDVCKFYNTRNTSSVKYNDKVKRFWRVGYRLFHGKWLKFMSGFKHFGSIISNECEKGMFSPEGTSINFAVPSTMPSSNHATIRKSEIKPGILNHILNKVAIKSPSNKTFKICMDGKKINSSTEGKHGEIDLWGYEQKPTLNERTLKFEQEITRIENTEDELKTYIRLCKVHVKDLDTIDKLSLKLQLLLVIYDISNRLRALRETVVRKEILKERFKQNIEGDWRKSNMVFVISALMTTLFDVKSIIKNLLRDVDQIGCIIAELNDVNYTAESVVLMNNQPNFVHLTASDKTFIGESTSYRFVKQQTQRWHALREKAKASGSTLNNAIGLSTLKKQQEHFDEKIFQKPKPPPSSSLQEKFDYGSQNEKNAVATFVGKVLPILNPQLQFIEEGCYEGSDDSELASFIVSPDGSLRSSPDDAAEIAIEIKCPFPGKLYTTPVLYEVPKYYVPQLLSEMHVLRTDFLYFISYSSESTTVQKVSFDEQLWNMMQREFLDTYGGDHPKRPSKKSAAVSDIQTKIDLFVKNNVEFVIEVPSVRAVECTKVPDSDHLFCSHFRENAEEDNCQNTIANVQEILHNTKKHLQKGYGLCKTKATEFLGFMISDLDRLYDKEQLHAVPIAYGLKGSSLPTPIIRNMLDHVLVECKRQGLYVPVCSFDGQWCKLAVRDRNDRPLTVLQLQKDVYANVKKMSKADQLSLMENANTVKTEKNDTFTNLENVIKMEKRTEVRTVYYYDHQKLKQKNVSTKVIVVHGHKQGDAYKMWRHVYNMVKAKTKIKDDVIGSTNEVDILSELPSSTIDQLSDDLVEEIHETVNQSDSQITRQKQLNGYMDVGNLFEQNNSTEETNNDNIIEGDGDEQPSIDENNVNEQQPIAQMDTNEHARIDRNEIDIELRFMLQSLQKDVKSNKRAKWNITEKEFADKFKDANTIDKSFFLYELKSCMTTIIGKLKANGVKVNMNDPKAKFVNLVAERFGDGSVILEKKKKKKQKMQPLKMLSKMALHKISKDYLNIIVAENKFPHQLLQWYNNSPFGSFLNIENIDCQNMKSWFSMPEYYTNIGYYVFMILDAYHQMCGARRLVCSNGMPSSCIYKESFYKIAEKSETNGCGLNLSLVKDLIDRQSIGYAIQTFSIPVEEALLDIGATHEAAFCRLIRNWYSAEDDPGMSAIQRCEYRLQLRDWLLKDVNFGKFPPFGNYVKDIPIILYEGLLTGIERRLQLFPLTKTGSYNVRSIGSLDIENFFGGFQDIDPRGTGVIRPDDIAAAIGVAVELTDARMDPDRGFALVTSSSKLYPCKEFNNWTDPTHSSHTYNINNQIRDISRITVKDHYFDHEERKRGTQKRKLGNIAKPNEPARKPQTVREFHRANESKLLHHVRRGIDINDDDV